MNVTGYDKSFNIHWGYFRGEFAPKGPQKVSQRGALYNSPSRFVIIISLHLLKTVLLRPPFTGGVTLHFTGEFTPVNPQIWLKLYLIFFIRAVNLYEYSYETNKESYRYVFSYILLSIFHFIFESFLTKSFQTLGEFTEYFCWRCENWICITVLPNEDFSIMNDSNVWICLIIFKFLTKLVTLTCNVFKNMHFIHNKTGLKWINSCFKVANDLE